jgi:hypothetical protein
MSETYSIDIRQNLVDLFALEEMLAYFEFQGVEEGGDHLSGICKISRSKKGKTRQDYLSLLFILDTPEDKTITAFRNAMEALTEENFKLHVPELDTVVSMPPMAVANDFHLKHVDIIFDDPSLDDRAFLSGKLYPALRDILNLETSELVWWNDANESVQGGRETGVRTNKTPASVFEKIKKLLGKGK